MKALFSTGFLVAGVAAFGGAPNFQQKGIVSYTEEELEGKIGRFVTYKAQPAKDKQFGNVMDDLGRKLFKEYEDVTFSGMLATVADGQKAAFLGFNSQAGLKKYQEGVQPYMPIIGQIGQPGDVGQLIGEIGFWVTNHDVSVSEGAVSRFVGYKPKPGKEEALKMVLNRLETKVVEKPPEGLAELVGFYLEDGRVIMAMTFESSEHLKAFGEGFKKSALGQMGPVLDGPAFVELIGPTVLSVKN